MPATTLSLLGTSMTGDISLYRHLLLLPTEKRQPAQLYRSYRQSKAKKFGALKLQNTYTLLSRLQRAQVTFILSHPWGIQLAFPLCSQIAIYINV